MDSNNKPILWYFADPMCSWCWGFSPHIERLKQSYQDRLLISLNLGGLRPGTTEAISPDLRDEILHHWHAVAKMSGQAFRFEGAMPEGFVYDTEPASRAVISFSHFHPEQTFAYFKAIQSAFYQHGEDVTQGKVLATLAEAFAVSAEAFMQRYNSEAMRQHTQAHFQRSRAAGVQGFPTLILTHPDRNELITQGYMAYDELEKRLQQAL